MKKPTALRSRKKVQNPQPPLDAASCEVFTPSADDVAYRAYLKHEDHGMEDGRDLADWLGAEAELIAEHHLAHA
ncbi:MAG: DUF2934 domain-containing protein [Verrucomicrobia bacterium]|nr:DUF2934 domain-containing protein [Verrucomicrobiota bacterium]